MIEDNRLKEILLKKLFDKELTESEENELEAWLQDPANRAFYESHLQKGQVFEVVTQVLDLNEPRLERKMREALDQKRRIRATPRTIAYLVAASLIVLSLAAGLLYREIQPANTLKGQVAMAKEILPATNKARLRLSNGSIVYLDSTRNGKIATQGNVSITKTAGELTYVSSNDPKALPTGLNELLVPRGAVFQLRLPDGTRVWLNSSTDITYPVTFGSERRIRINGEGFFDVAKDPARPFIVETSHGVTQVLGTTFNVNAYTEDSVEMITVVSGAVTFNITNNSLTLRPGEQAFQRGERLSLEHPNLQAITAWRRGFFYFQDADIRTIMRQISRFYDVAVRYEGQPGKETYDGLISRDLTLSEALVLLSKLNIKAALADKTITVEPETAPR